MSELLAGYAVSENCSKGRRFPENAHPYRADFERDRDRVIHSEAFRRLEGKTQVFTPGVNDSYRNRLTHSIEVSQIGRTIAKVLQVNESLTEVICLAHDLGHSPFGHMGETILDELMCDFGGFEHNRQTLRIVDLLEHPYPDFTGLNLMYETRLGLARHRSPYDKPSRLGFKEGNCSLEGQIAILADRIAYNCHDLEDGIRAGLLSSEKLNKIKLFSLAQERINADAILDSSVRRTRVAKVIIDILVSDCIDTSKRAIADAKLQTVDDVCSSDANLVVLSIENEAGLREMEDFLLHNLYLHKTFGKVKGEIKIGLERLFVKLCEKPELMPGFYQRLIEKEGRQRVVADYISGMTDRFCLKYFEKIQPES